MTDINDDDIWFVQLAEGSVRAFSLDELDEAFQAGSIDEATLVRKDGETTWMTLAELLGGHEHEEVEPAAPMSTIPVAMSVAPAAPSPTSSVPPLAELPDLDENPSFGASRKKTALAFGIAAAAVIGLAAFTATRMSATTDASNLGASLPKPNPVAAAAAPVGETAAADAGPRFNEEQRRLLLEADKKREAEAAARRPVRSAGSQPSKPIKVGDPFKKGGDKYDPLNGAL